MPDILERKASVLNGLIIVAGCALGTFEATRLWGISIAAFMGIGLIFSGWANFCGWYQILGPRCSSQTGQIAFWIGGREAHRNGLNSYYGTKISEATKLVNESASEDEKSQHLEAVNRLRMEHRLKLEQADHAVH